MSYKVADVERSYICQQFVVLVGTTGLGKVPQHVPGQTDRDELRSRLPAVA